MIILNLIFLDIRLEGDRRSSKQLLSNTRCTIEGISNIKKYCKSGELNDIQDTKFIEKQFYLNPKMPSVKFNSLLNSEYNLRINLKNELPLDELSYQVVDFKKKFNMD